MEIGKSHLISRTLPIFLISFGKKPIMKKFVLSAIIYLSASLILLAQPCDQLLLSESFTAAQPSGWTGDFNTSVLVEGWLTESGPTMTPLTGPEGAFMGTHYLYMETSGPAPVNASFSVSTPSISIPGTGTTTLSLAYLMYGADMGTFLIVINSGTATDTIFTRSGQQHADGSIDSWEEITLSLNDYKNASIAITFIGMKNISGLSDMAIDEVQVCHINQTIPTLGQWGVIILLLLLLSIAIVGIRQFAIPSLS